MRIVTRIVWPDGNWSERRFHIADTPEFENFWRVARAALRNGAHIQIIPEEGV